MLTPDDVRALALALPEATEQDHHGRPSFRVGGKIFATLWTPEAVNVMAAEDDIFAAVERWPDACSTVHWGKQLSAVRFDLRVAEADALDELLEAAWRRLAPRRLLAEPA